MPDISLMLVCATMLILMHVKINLPFPHQFVNFYVMLPVIFFVFSQKSKSHWCHLSLLKSNSSPAKTHSYENATGHKIYMLVGRIDLATALHFPVIMPGNWWVLVAAWHKINEDDTWCKRQYHWVRQKVWSIKTKHFSSRRLIALWSFLRSWFPISHLEFKWVPNETKQKYPASMRCW